MKTMLRRNLLALMLGATALSYTATAILLDTPAFAKRGADDGAGHDAGDDHGGSRDRSSDDRSDSSDDHGGSRGRGHSSDDSDHDRGDDNGGSRDRGSSDDDDDDDGNRQDRKDAKKAEKDARKAARSAARPTATITLSAASLANVRAGSHVVVDQLGRQLEIRVLMQNGQQVIRAKPHGGDARRNPGPITTISVVPVSAFGGGNDDGTPDQGPGDN